MYNYGLSQLFIQHPKVCAFLLVHMKYLETPTHTLIHQGCEYIILIGRVAIAVPWSYKMNGDITVLLVSQLCRMSEGLSVLTVRVASISALPLHLKCTKLRGKVEIIVFQLYSISESISVLSSQEHD